MRLAVKRYVLLKSRMSRCPKCRAKIPFIKTGFLSKIKNWVICPTCESYCVANKAQLSAIGGAGGAAGAGLGSWVISDLRYGGGLWYIGLILIIILFFGLAYYQHQNIRLTLSKMPESVKKSLEPIEIHTGPIPSKSEPIEYLKYRYRNYSKEKLLEVAKSKDYREDAKIAASELLKEKYNT